MSRLFLSRNIETQRTRVGWLWWAGPTWALGQADWARGRAGVGARSGARGAADGGGQGRRQQRVPPVQLSAGAHGAHAAGAAVGAVGDQRPAGLVRHFQSGPHASRRGLIDLAATPATVADVVYVDDERGHLFVSRTSAVTVCIRGNCQCSGYVGGQPLFSIISF